MKVTTKNAVSVEGSNVYKIMADIERMKRIVACTNRSVAEWRRVEEARFVMQRHSIGYNAEDMDRTMAELKQEVVTQYESAVNK